MKYIVVSVIALGYILFGYYLMGRLDHFLADVHSSGNELGKASLRVGLEWPSAAPSVMEQMEAALINNSRANTLFLRGSAQELLRELERGSLDAVILGAAPTAPQAGKEALWMEQQMDSRG